MCQTCNVVSYFGHDSCASLVQPVQQVYHTKAMSTIAAAQNMAMEAPGAILCQARIQHPHGFGYMCSQGHPK